MYMYVYMCVCYVCTIVYVYNYVDFAEEIRQHLTSTITNWTKENGML